MARSRAAIKLEMTTAFMANESLAVTYGFTQGALFADEFSIASFENILFDILSYFMFLLEQIFDTHKQEVNDIIENKFPHRPSWYRTKAKEFQYGFDLIEDSDKYDNTGFTDDEIEASKIIKYSAVPANKGQKSIKIATEVGGVLSPITELQLTAFSAYMDVISDWGVDYIIVNQLPDVLQLNLEVYINPLVLNDTGMSIKNGNYPVQDAILEYMKELPFDGELVLFDLETKIKQVEGVVIPRIVNAETQVFDISTNGYSPAQPITVKTIPVSGYFTIPNFDNVSYVV